MILKIKLQQLAVALALLGASIPLHAQSTRMTQQDSTPDNSNLTTELKTRLGLNSFGGVDVSTGSSISADASGAVDAAVAEIPMGLGSGGSSSRKRASNAYLTGATDAALSAGGYPAGMARSNVSSAKTMSPALPYSAIESFRATVAGGGWKPRAASSPSSTSPGFSSPSGADISIQTTTEGGELGGSEMLADPFSGPQATSFEKPGNGASEQLCGLACTLKSTAVDSDLEETTSEAQASKEGLAKPAGRLRSRPSSLSGTLSKEKVQPGAGSLGRLKRGRRGGASPNSPGDGRSY